MEKNFHDKELDKAFRSAVEGMETEPSDKFWEAAEKNIALRTGIISGQKASQWKKLSFLLIFLLGVSTFYITYLNVQLKNVTPETGDNHLQKIPAIEENKTQAKADPVPPPALNNNPVSNVQQPIAESDNGISKPQSRNDQSRATLYPTDLTVSNAAQNSNTQIPSENHSNPNVISKGNSLGGNDKTTDYFSNIPELKDTNSSVVSSTTLINIDTSSFDTFPIAITNPQTDSLPVQVSNQAIIDDLPGNNSRFFVSGFFAPTSIKKKVTSNDQGNNNNNDESGEVNNNEDQDFSYTAGLKFGMDLGTQWTLRTGINYSRSSCQIKPRVIYATSTASGLSRYSVLTSSGTVDFTTDDDTLDVEGESFQELAYISTPLQVSYNFGVKRFGFFVTAGLSGNFLVAGKTHLMLSNDNQEENEVDGDITGLRKFYWGYSAGFGINYRLSKHFLLSAEPFFTGSLQPINRSTPIKTHPLEFGIGAGLIFYF